MKIKKEKDKGITDEISKVWELDVLTETLEEVK